MSRLEERNIRRMVEGPAVSIYVRDHCMAAVGTAPGAGHGTGGGQGSTGFMTEQGLAYLVWHEGQPFLDGKGGRIPATPEQVEAIRQFSEDLKEALREDTGTR